MAWRFRLRNQPSPADTCDTLQPLLSLYSDGLASPSETRQVERHLAECAECQSALRWMEATHLVIARRPFAEPPVNLRLRIAQAIAEAEQARPRPRPAARPVILRPAYLAGAAAVGCTLVGVLVVQHSSPPLTPVRLPSVPVTTATPAPAVPSPRSPRVAARPKSHSAVQVAAATGTDHKRLNGVLLNTHHPAPHATQIAEAFVVPSSKPAFQVAPSVHSFGVVLPKRNGTPAPKVALLIKSAPLRHKAGTAIDAVREAARPVLPAVPDTTAPVTAPPTITASAGNQADGSRPEIASAEISVPAADHPAHVDVLSGVRARLASYQGERHDIQIAMERGARAATTAGAQFVMLPAVYTPTALTKSPAVSNH